MSMHAAMQHEPNRFCYSFEQTSGYTIYYLSCILIQSSTLMWDTTATRQMLKSAIVLAATDQPSSHVEFGFV